MSASWKAVVQQKRAERDRAINEARERLNLKTTAFSEDEPFLLASGEPYLVFETFFRAEGYRGLWLATGIVSKIKAGEWNATTVVSAYIRQAIRAHEKTNCLTESNLTAT